MTTETTPPTAAGEDPPGKWEELIDEWTGCVKGAMDRAADRARDNVKLARAGKYGLGAWLEDVQWFWGEVAEEATQAAKTVQKTARRTPEEKRPHA
jgi:hypothetical protein